MTNRIDGGAPRPVQDTTAESTDSAKSAENTESSGTAEAARPKGLVSADQWEKAMESFDDFVGSSSAKSDSTDDAPAEAGGADLEEPRAVWEMMVPDSVSDAVESYSEYAATQETAEPASPAPASPAANESFDLQQNGPANTISSALDTGHLQNAGPREIRREMAQIIQNLPPGQRSELVDLAANGDDLRADLMEIHDNARVVDDIVSEVQGHVLAETGAKITAIARPQMEAGMEALQNLNDSQESRRAFLATVASGAESKEDIAQVLSEFGLSSGATDQLSEVLDELRSDESAMNSFLNGERGDRSLGNFRGEYAQAERVFERQLNSMHGGLDSLHKEMGTNEIRHDKFLTDPRVAPIRDQVLADMGAVTGPPGQENALGAFFNEATDDSTSAQNRERNYQAGAGFAGGVVLSLATGGTALPAILLAAGGAGAQAVPDVAIAHQDVHRAQGAVNIELAGAQLTQMAERDRNVAYAVAAANVVVAGLSTGVGKGISSNMQHVEKTPVKETVVETLVESGAAAAMEIGDAAHDNYNR